METLTVTSTVRTSLVTIPDGAGTNVLVDASAEQSQLRRCMESPVFANPTSNLTIQIGSGWADVTLNSPAAGFTRI